MEIPINTIPKDVVPSLFGVYVQIKTIEQMVVEKNNTITIDGKPLTNTKKDIVQIDSATFKCISLSFFCDKNNVYGLNYILKSASVKYYLSKIKGVDLTSFKPISMYYAQDKNRSYFGPGGKIIKEIDLQLFHDDYANNKRISGKSVDNTIDYSSTFSWSSDFMLGKEHVYYRGKVLKEADPKTFKRPHQSYFIDKNRIYEKNGLSIKAFEGVDMDSLIFFKNKSYYCTDKHQPLDCYVFGNELNERHFDSFKPYFEAQRNQLPKDYWWFEMEKRFATKYKNNKD